MKNEKILNEEVLSDEQLENVAGGTYIDSQNVAGFLYQAGYDNALGENGLVNYDGMRSALNGLGITAHDNGGATALGGQRNTYTIDATGETLDQAGMMKFLREKFPNTRYKEIVEPGSIADVMKMVM